MYAHRDGSISNTSVHIFKAVFTNSGVWECPLFFWVSGVPVSVCRCLVYDTNINILISIIRKSSEVGSLFLMAVLGFVRHGISRPYDCHAVLIMVDSVSSYMEGMCIGYVL